MHLSHGNVSIIYSLFGNFLSFYNTTVIFQSHITLRNTDMMHIQKPQPLLSTAGIKKRTRKVTHSQSSTSVGRVDRAIVLAFDNAICALTVIRMVDELVHETHGHGVSSRHREDNESGTAGIRSEGWRMQYGW